MLKNEIAWIRQMFLQYDARIKNSSKISLMRCNCKSGGIAMLFYMTECPPDKDILHEAWNEPA